MILRLGLYHTGHAGHHVPFNVAEVRVVFSRR